MKKHKKSVVGPVDFLPPFAGANKVVNNDTSVKIAVYYLQITVPISNF